MDLLKEIKYNEPEELIFQWKKHSQHDPILLFRRHFIDQELFSCLFLLKHGLRVRLT